MTSRPNHRCLNDILCYCSNPKIEHASSCSRGAALCRFKALHSEIGPTRDEDLVLHGGVDSNIQPDASTLQKNPRKKS
ncbi:MAG: hypothetical protein PHQ43_11800 [Dehalococcoidales bacterium]|nr:hypothetical protein [Dehalococcoidales bacterium]